MLHMERPRQKNKHRNISNSFCVFFLSNYRIQMTKGDESYTFLCMCAMCAPLPLLVVTIDSGGNVGVQGMGGLAWPQSGDFDASNAPVVSWMQSIFPHFVHFVHFFIPLAFC